MKSGWKTTPIVQLFAVSGRSARLPAKVPLA